MPGGSRGRDKQGENGAARGIIGNFYRAASLCDVAFDQIQANPMIAARFGGDAAFKDPVTDRRCNANALVGDFNNQLLFAEFYQHFYRRVGKRRPLCRFDGVIQQVANN